MEHPTPPQELVQQWDSEAVAAEMPEQLYIATQAARWGADQELEACCQHIRNHQWGFVTRPDGTKEHRALDLQYARRPKPPSLKEQAVAALADLEGLLTFFQKNNPTLKYTVKGRTSSEVIPTIRRALEALGDE